MQVHHMNGGEGENSYFKNSLYQKKVILKAKPILEESISELLLSQKSLPECLTMADLGCSSGPNTLVPLWQIIETIDSSCTKLNKKSPNLQYFLNDLPGNDFNTVFKTLIPNFHQKLKKEKGSKFEDCLIGAMPGSFYGRLFPPNSLHFVHSSSSLHWRSQVPEELVSEYGSPLKGGIFYVTESSPTHIQKAYVDQYEKDFTKFLKSRSVEMVRGGHMVLNFIGKSDKNQLELIQDSLKEIVNKGMIEESKLDNFMVPFYSPSAEQVRNVIEREDSFDIKRIKEFELSWDANVEDGNDDLSFNILERGKYVANYMRAVTETMLASHFGDDIIDNIFHRLFLKVIDCLEKKIGLSNHVVISMLKK